jgi:hypothetical protein
MHEVWAVITIVKSPRQGVQQAMKFAFQVTGVAESNVSDKLQEDTAVGRVPVLKRPFTRPVRCDVARPHLTLSGLANV